jgi:hypothetical protein
MTFSQAEWEVLSSAIEDCYGLWEVSGGIRSPSVHVSIDGPEVKSAIRSLLKKKLIYLCWFNHYTNEEESIADNESEKLLADPAVWQPPSSKDRYVAFFATPAGDRAWRQSKPPVREAVH